MSLSPDRTQDELYKELELTASRHTPDGIGRFLVGMLRWFFSNPDHFGKLSGNLQQLVYSPTDKNGMQIDLDMNFNLVNGEKYPAIKISFTETNYTPVAMGNRARVMQHNEGEVTVTMAQTGYSITCYANDKATSYQIALLSMQFLRSCQRRFTTAGLGNCGILMNKFNVSKLSGIQAVESKESSPFYRTGVLVECHYESIALEYEESLPLKTLTADAIVPYLDTDGSHL